MASHQTAGKPHSCILRNSDARKDRKLHIPESTYFWEGCFASTKHVLHGIHVLDAIWFSFSMLCETIVPCRDRLERICVDETWILQWSKAHDNKYVEGTFLCQCMCSRCGTWWAALLWLVHRDSRNPPWFILSCVHGRRITPRASPWLHDEAMLAHAHTRVHSHIKTHANAYQEEPHTGEAMHSQRLYTDARFMADNKNGQTEKWSQTIEKFCYSDIKVRQHLPKCCCRSSRQDALA